MSILFLGNYFLGTGKHRGLFPYGCPRGRFRHCSEFEDKIDRVNQNERLCATVCAFGQR